MDSITPNSESLFRNKDRIPTVETNLTNEKQVLNVESHTDAKVNSKFLLQNHKIDYASTQKRKPSRLNFAANEPNGKKEYV